MMLIQTPRPSESARGLEITSISVGRSHLDRVYKPQINPILNSYLISTSETVFSAPCKKVYCLYLSSLNTCAQQISPSC